jgi:hypothetical protein
MTWQRVSREATSTIGGVSRIARRHLALLHTHSRALSPAVKSVQSLCYGQMKMPPYEYKGDTEGTPYTTLGIVHYWEVRLSACLFDAA